MVQFNPGDRVTWLWEGRGGYGYVTPVKAEVIRSTEKRVLIKVEMIKPVRKFLEKWVKPENLRIKEANK